MDSRILVIDSNSRTAYPFSATEAADAKVQEILAGMDDREKQYYRDILSLEPDDDLSSITAEMLEEYESEGLMVTHETGSIGIAEKYSTADRATAFYAWPEEMETFHAWGEPIGAYKTVGVPDATPIKMTMLENDNADNT